MWNDWFTFKKFVDKNVRKSEINFVYYYILVITTFHLYPQNMKKANIWIIKYTSTTFRKGFFDEKQFHLHTPSRFILECFIAPPNCKSDLVLFAFLFILVKCIAGLYVNIKARTEVPWVARASQIFHNIFSKDLLKTLPHHKNRVMRQCQLNNCVDFLRSPVVEFDVQYFKIKFCMPNTLQRFDVHVSLSTINILRFIFQQCLCQT